MMSSVMYAKRGIIVTTPMIAKRDEFEITATGLDPHEMRYWVLLWDQICHAELNFCKADFSGDAEVEFLERAGIFSRSHVLEDFILECPSEDTARHFPTYFTRLFADMERKEPGVWSLATGPRCLTLDDDMGGDGRGVLFRLNRALPVPDKDVPLDDILKFKERRRDELLALRYGLDQIYGRIVSAPDQAHSFNSEITELQRVLSDYVNSTQDGKIKKWRIGNLQAELQIRSAVNAGFVAYSQGLSVAQSVFTGLAAGLEITASSGLRGLRRENGLPWRYIDSYFDEVF